MINMKKFVNKLNKLIVDLPHLKDVIIQQNQDIEDMSQELLGVKMADNIVGKVVEEQLIEEVNQRLKGAFE